MESMFAQVLCFSLTNINDIFRSNGYLYILGSSIVFPDMPAQKGYVRGENGPGCWVMTPIPNEPNKCVFQWLLDTNLKVSTS